MKDLLFLAAMTLIGCGVCAAGIVVGWYLRGVHDQAPLASIHHLPPRPRSIPEPRRVRRHSSIFDWNRDGGGVA